MTIPPLPPLHTPPRLALRAFYRAYSRNLAGQCWAAVITDRGQAVRIISVRRARKEEVALYVQANFH
ncbi:BrnT family toxin [Desulfovibrio sp. XJ01]|nr:BrnT family toxin [Nitratidesulfovibrio liaohensis]